MAHPSHEALARVFSSTLLLGPPVGEKLTRLIEHLFTADEAGVARHLPYILPKPIEKIARRSRRPVGEIRPLLEAMADKRTIYRNAQGYSVLPLIPGMFEYMLQCGVDTPWHREYARLLLDLYSTGFARDYSSTRTSAIRNIPVAVALDHDTRSVTPDLMEEMIDRHDTMGVLTVCQCRQSMRFVGKDCRRATPEHGCLLFGSAAGSVERAGNGRLVSRDEMRAIVVERVERGLMFMTGNVGAGVPNAVCTCCDCCCHGLETINQWDAAGFMAPPRFKARVDEIKCNRCGKCARACNVLAHTMADKQHHYRADRCLGCGLCVPACKQGAITLAPNPAFRPPKKTFQRLGLGMMPASLLTSLKILAGRKMGKD